MFLEIMHAIVIVINKKFSDNISSQGYNQSAM